MKKFYLLLSAACLVASASAVEKEKMASKAGAVKAESSKLVASTVKATKVAGVRHEKIKSSKVVKRAVDSDMDFCFFRPAENIGAIGMSQAGYGLNGVWGFASSYGELEFEDFSTNVASYSWQYSDLNDASEDGWNYQYSESQTLAIKSGVGQMATPSLDVKYNSGADGYYELETSGYLCGGGARYWIGNDSDGTPFGVTAYQNAGMTNPEGYTGSSTYKMNYAPGARNYDANGVYNDASRGWKAFFTQRYGEGVDNIQFENFTFLQPAPASTYFITQGWAWFNVTAKDATQLLSYIYPVDESGVISETPMALGYASIPKGDTACPVFYYNPLNEDGDELEGEVYIDCAVAITIEGFVGNSAISECGPVSGFYPFSYSAYSANDYANADICKDPTVYARFSLTVNGESASVFGYDSGLYYYNQNTNADGSMVDDDTLSLLDYGQFMTDAVYPFIYTVDGKDVVYLPKAGGSVDLTLDALYYLYSETVGEDGLYDVEYPEWLSVEYKDPDTDTGVSIIGLTVASSDEDRSGKMTISGLGVSLELTIVQGEDSAVSVVKAENGVEYFDLAGRRVINPEKGIYVKVSGNKAEKVAL